MVGFFISYLDRENKMFLNGHDLRPEWAVGSTGRATDS